MTLSIIRTYVWNYSVITVILKAYDKVIMTFCLCVTDSKNYSIIVIIMMSM